MTDTERLEKGDRVEVGTPGSTWATGVVIDVSVKYRIILDDDHTVELRGVDGVVIRKIKESEAQ